MTSIKYRASPFVAAVFIASLLSGTALGQESNVAIGQIDSYMGAPVTLEKAPNGAIANKKILDGIEKVAWLKPTIDQPAEGIWQFGGYGLAPITVIDTDEGLIAFDTGDSKHDGEILLEAIRSVSHKPIKVIIYGHSHTVLGAGVLAEGNKDVMVIGHPNLNAVVEENARSAGIPAYFQEIGPYLHCRMSGSPQSLKSLHRRRTAKLQV